GVQCQAFQSCVNGECVDRCVLPPPTVPCHQPCPQGLVCRKHCIPSVLCGGVQCATCETCIQRTCVPNPCCNVVCPQGQFCSTGQVVAAPKRQPAQTLEGGGSDQGESCASTGSCAQGTCVHHPTSHDGGPGIGGGGDGGPPPPLLDGGPSGGDGGPSNP